VREPITVIIVTTGIWYVLDNLTLLIFGPEYRTIQDNPLRGKMLEFGDMLISVPKLWGFCTAILTAAAVYLFFQKTRMGRAIRATSLDREAASLMGIKQFKVYNIAFGIGTATAGIAAVTLIPFYNVFPTVGVLFDIKGFIIVVLGGLGSIGGAILGGIIVGLIESVGPQFMAATWTEGIVYGLFLLVLFVKPSGLFGVKYDW
jgi:branched-chain amino acid transport system permease protein